jgi:hypothetical protein
MPHWTFDRCGARLCSASDSLETLDCPPCAGNFARRPEDPVPAAGYSVVKGLGPPVSRRLAREIASLS